MKFILSIGGASGSIYGIRLLEELHKTKHTVYLIISKGAKEIISHETKYTIEELIKKADYFYENYDMFAGPASGSFLHDGMIICPCSMKTLSAVANGYGDTLTSRAASCCLKENKPLILVPRETPLDLPSLQNMKQAMLSGAVLLPAMPGFYHKPKTIEDVINFIVGKVLDQLRIKHSLFNRWK